MSRSPSVPIATAKPASPASPEEAWTHWRRTRPLLRHSLSLHRIEYRGEPWMILHDHLGRDQIRLDADTAELLQRLDGLTQLEQALRTNGWPPEQDRERLAALLEMLTRLYEVGWLTLPDHADIDSLVARGRQVSMRQQRARWLRLMSPRFHLFDPDPLLTRLGPVTAQLLHPLALIAWGLFVLLAGLFAWMHWPDLALYGAQRIDSPLSWMLLLLVYPVIKGLHELGHGLALKACGGEVNGMGITLLVFMPIPYVDARSATLLPQRSKRMLVSGAGILVEALLAALALFFWLNLSDGVARETAFVVLTVAGLSTLLFNGNPLLRYDGYYVLSDWLEIPNLATRANALYGFLARRYWLGMEKVDAPQNAPGERPWLLLYAPLSLAYRLFVSIAIALLLVSHVPSLGVALAIWLLATQWGVPLWRQLSGLVRSTRGRGREKQPLVRLSLGLLLVLLLGLLPLPVSTHVDGVLLMPESKMLRVTAEGVWQAQWARDGDTVEPDQPLLRLADPQLENEIAVLRASVREFEAQKDALDIADRVERDLARQRLLEAQDDLEDALQRQSRLTVVSPAEGVLHLIRRDGWEGRYLRQGDLLGYVADREQASVRAVAQQEDMVRIREGVSDIRVRLAGDPDPALRGRLLHQTPMATETLPSAALGDRGGGAIAVDSRDPHGLTSLEPVFLLDIAIESKQGGRFVGRRAHITLQHAHASLLSRLYDSVRRLLLSELGE